MALKNRSRENNNFLLLFTNMIIFFIVQILFEAGIYKDIVGYTDWEFYRSILSTRGSHTDFFWGGYISFLASVKLIFGESAIYFLYFVNVLFLSYWLTRLQSYCFFRFGLVGAAYSFNPIIYMILPGLFKETIITIFSIFALIFWRSRKKLISTTFPLFFALCIIFIRPHLFGIIFIRNTVLFSILLFFFISVSLFLLNFIDFGFFVASYLEMRKLGFADMPILLITDAADIWKLPYNFLIYLLGPLFSENPILFLFGSSYMLSFSIIFIRSSGINRKTMGLFIFFYNFYYTFFVSVSGTAFRVVAFSLLISVFYCAIVGSGSHRKGLSDPRYG